MKGEHVMTTGSLMPEGIRSIGEPWKGHGSTNAMA